MDNNNKGTARTWFCVYWGSNLDNMNVYSDMEKDPERVKNELQAYFDKHDGSHYSAICVSKDGKYHIHDVVTMSSPVRLNQISKMFGNVHSDIMRGTKEQASDYINKKGKFEEKGEKIILQWGNIESIENNQGSRNDLNDFDVNCLSKDFNLDDFLLQFYDDTLIRMYTNRFYRIRRIKAQEFRKVEVIYVEGEAGSGKSRGAFEKYPGAFRVSTDIKNNFPFDGYSCQDIIWLDELRPGYFTHSQLMQILDGYPMNVNVKGSNCPACWTKVIITTAVPLSDWYHNNELEYNENQKQQFLRRITEHYKAVGAPSYEWVKAVETNPEEVETSKGKITILKSNCKFLDSHGIEHVVDIVKKNNTFKGV